VVRLDFVYFLHKSSRMDEGYDVSWRERSERRGWSVD